MITPGTQNSGLLLVVSAPSGAGKTSLLAELVADDAHLRVAVSHTTRPQRRGEVDGADYHFVSHVEFEAMLASNDFLEHANVFGNMYGTSRSAIVTELDQGRDVILEIDWQGAQQIRRRLPQAVSVFIMPPSRAALVERLTTRGQDDPESIAKRSAEAAIEISHYGEFDYVVVNDRFEEALNDLRAIVTAERLRLDYRATSLESLVEALLSEGKSIK
jgi:guanylate kinase